jgi:thiamine transport system substrate-binding protein
LILNGFREVSLLRVSKFFILLFLLSLGFLKLAKSSTPELVIYAYDSFLAPGGLGPKIIPLFEKKWSCRVKALASGDGTQLLARIKLDQERGKPTAHVVVGIDQQNWPLLQPWTESWGDWVPLGGKNLIHLDSIPKSGFLPYDYGVFSLMMDLSQLDALKIPVPEGGKISFQELLDSRWKRNILLEDPRTSTPGMAFLLYSVRLLSSSLASQDQNAEVWKFWDGFRGQWLTLTPGWSAAYSLFLKKEAPLVWTYLTSQAYHIEKAQPRYQALLFKEGQPFQVEGAALVRGSMTESPETRALARKFLEFLISAEVQALIPQSAWMMPVLKGTPLPMSFRSLPQPTGLVGTQTDSALMTKLLSRWREIVGRSP